MLYEALSDKKVSCHLCARRCTVPNGGVGFCRVRKNVDGKLYSLNYGKACTMQVDEIQKKPLFNFAPSTKAFSIATVGCNFRCQFCCNWVISQEEKITGEEISPEEVVDKALKSSCQGISYTYTEPTIFFEYAYDTAKIAHEKGLYNTFVTNGYMTPEAVKTIAPYLDAITVDFKGGASPKFYREVMQVPSVEPIFEALNEMKKQGIFIEITNLIVPEIGDSPDDIQKLVGWIKNNLGEDTPIHFLAFSPNYYLIDLPQTPIEAIDNAIKTAEKAGLKYVYAGNAPGHHNENTYCWSCGELLIKRWNVYLLDYKLDGDKCPKCGTHINIGGLNWVPKRRPGESVSKSFD